MIYDCIIIGAGASGLFFSGAINEHVSGLILEKTGRAGTKLLMSGNGQCNITHAGSIKDFIKCYGKNGGKIRSCLYKYNNLQLIEFLKCNGVPLVIRDDDKVFPESMDAHDILKLLLSKTAANGFRIKFSCPVVHISRKNNLWELITADGGGYVSQTVVIASGGCSYPASGSDGSIFPVLRKELGLAVTKLKPALSAIRTVDYHYSRLSGISLMVQTSISDVNGKKAEIEGPLLFTHNELSGPAILNISKFAESGDTLKINYLYPLNQEQVLQRLKAAVSHSSMSLYAIIASEFSLPKRFCRLLTEIYGNGLKALSAALTGESFTIDHVCGFNRAMVTSGGIDLSQIDMKTMNIKGHAGLFAIGEVCDIDGITGGYNLQFAYSSARAAADAVLKTVAR